MEEIEKNDFNLNISRYVSTSIDEEQIDLLEANKRLVDIEKKAKEAADRHNQFRMSWGCRRCEIVMK